jgi:hypothetical protein
VWTQACGTRVDAAAGPSTSAPGTLVVKLCNTCRTKAQSLVAAAHTAAGVAEAARIAHASAGAQHEALVQSTGSAAARATTEALEVANEVTAELETVFVTPSAGAPATGSDAPQSGGPSQRPRLNPSDSPLSGPLATTLAMLQSGSGECPCTRPCTRPCAR